MEWPFIATNLNQLSLANTPILKQYILGSENMQNSQFRIYCNLEKYQKRQSITFRDEIFEDQYIGLNSFQKYEATFNKIDDEKKANRLKQFWAFVE